MFVAADLTRATALLVAAVAAEALDFAVVVVAAAALEFAVVVVAAATVGHLLPGSWTLDSTMAAAAVFAVVVAVVLEPVAVVGAASIGKSVEAGLTGTVPSGWDVVR